MNDYDGSERSRAAEDACFRRNDDERLAWSREVDRISRERAALAQALGAPGTDVVNQLYEHGLRVSSAGVLDWLPAVEVAWTDGANEAERHALCTQFSADDRASDEGLALLDGWLTERPPDGLYVAGRRALRWRVQALEADERPAAVGRLVAICEAVGRAAGGAFGVGALSSGERRRIDVIRRDLEQPI